MRFCVRYARYAGHLSISQRKRKISDKYHTSSFSFRCNAPFHPCWHCSSFRSELKLIFLGETVDAHHLLIKDSNEPAQTWILLKYTIHYTWLTYVKLESRWWLKYRIYAYVLRLKLQHGKRSFCEKANLLSKFTNISRPSWVSLWLYGWISNV